MDAIFEIGILGLGHVGTSVLEILSKKRDVLRGKLGANFTVKKILIKDPSKKRTPLAQGLTTTLPQDILEDDDIKIVVELMGGEEPALEYIKKALRKGKSVVTANKEVISRHGPDLIKLARENGARLLYEASVGGGIPLIRPLEECLVANKMSMLMGIVNGTTNFILSKMGDEALEAEEALKDAQRLGYAESDPSNDLNGADAARKIAILAAIGFDAKIGPSDVKTCGIGDVGLSDVKYAKGLGCKVKLIAYCRRQEGKVEIAVCPMLLPEEHPLSSVNGPFNAVLAEGDAVGRVMFYGQGAGGMPTASAVLGDIASIVRNPTPQAAPCEKEGAKILAPDEIKSRFYLRLRAVDRPGVLSAIAGVLGDENISLSMVLQKTSFNGIAEIVMVTHEAKSGNMEKAITDLKGCDAVSEIPCLMRVWE